MEQSLGWPFPVTDQATSRTQLPLIYLVEVRALRLCMSPSSTPRSCCIDMNNLKMNSLPCKMKQLRWPRHANLISTPNTYEQQNNKYGLIILCCRSPQKMISMLINYYASWFSQLRRGSFRSPHTLLINVDPMELQISLRVFKRLRMDVTRAYFSPIVIKYVNDSICFVFTFSIGES